MYPCGPPPPPPPTGGHCGVSNTIHQVQTVISIDLDHVQQPKQPALCCRSSTLVHSPSSIYMLEAEKIFYTQVVPIIEIEALYGSITPPVFLFHCYIHYRLWSGSLNVFSSRLVSVCRYDKTRIHWHSVHYNLEGCVQVPDFSAPNPLSLSLSLCLCLSLSVSLSLSPSLSLYLSVFLSLSLSLSPTPNYLFFRIVAFSLNFYFSINLCNHSSSSSS